jgi:propanol-preferring alcohol dehydrogenase
MHGVWGGLLQAELKPGQWLVIVGSGRGLGHLGVQFAKALGLKVVGIEARDVRLELTRKPRADGVVDAGIGTEKVVREVKKVTGEELAYATVNMSDAKGAAALACAVTRVHGTLVQLAQVSSKFIEFVPALAEGWC